MTDIILQNKEIALPEAPQKPLVRSLSQEQQMVMDSLGAFCDNPELDFFVLNGSAGTGKTTTLRALTEYLRNNSITFELLAPTGRSAKILSSKTGVIAKTLHSYLYYPIERIDNKSKLISIEFVPKDETIDEKTVYIVDESSLVSDRTNNSPEFYSKKSLLSDLIQHYRKSPENSKLIFVGDTYQLPPINEKYSPALSPDYLKTKYGLKGQQAVLKKIYRQKDSSYILSNANLIKYAIDNNNMHHSRLRHKKLYNERLAVDYYTSLFDEDDHDNIVCLAWTNETVRHLNSKIRASLFNNPNYCLVPGERIIMNRTHFTDPYFPNGETGTLIEFYPETIEEVSDFRFADGLFEFEKLDGQKMQVQKKFNMDYLLQGLPEDNSRKVHNLWHHRYRYNKTFRETKNKKDDPYLNALDIRYGYVMTTHKAQGGEWDQVILHSETPHNSDRLQWLYTAVTRAKEELCMYC